MSTGEFEKTQAFSPIIKRAKDTISMMENAMASEGTMPAAVWIFRAKNYQKMKDVQEIQAVGVNQGDVPNNAEDIVATLPEAPEEEPIEIEQKND